MGKRVELKVVTDFTDAEALKKNLVFVQDDTVPEPNDGEVLIEITCRPVNPADTYSISMIYPGFKPASLPAVVGLDGVGVVRSGGKKFKDGQRVVAAPWPTTSGNGTWQQWACVSEDSLIGVPEGMSDKVACQFFVNPVTIVGMLEVAAVPKGGWLLQTAAGSTLGRMLIQVAKHEGIKTINIVRRAEQKEELLALGADEVICSSEEDAVKRVKEITGGEGAHAALDAVGAESTGQVVQSVRRGGEVFIYGSLAGTEFTAPIADLLFGGKVVRGFWLGPWLMSMSPEARQTSLKHTMELLSSGVIKPHMGQSFPLECAAEAVIASQAVGRNGKVFLEG